MTWTKRDAAMRSNWGKPLGPDVFPALSLRQPWAWAVVAGVRGPAKNGARPVRKNIENRRWSTPFRGEFLVHAAKGMTMSEYLEARGYIEKVLDELVGPQHEGAPPYKSLERGGFVGVARLVDVIRPCCLPGPQAPISAVFCEHPWHMHEQYGFVLADVRPVPFTPWKGCLGFFGVPRDVAAALIARSRVIE